MDKQKKFTILAPQLGINPESGLGGAIMDYEVLVGLARRGHRIILILPEGEWAPQEDNLGVIYLKKRWFHRFLIYKYNWLFIGEIMKVICNTHVDVIRVHSPYGVGIGIALLRIIYPRLPLLWMSYLHLEDKTLWSFLDRILPRYMDVITTISMDTIRDLRVRCPALNSKVVNVVPCGVDVYFYQPIPGVSTKRHKIGIEDDEIILLFVGQLIPRKGLDILLRSWAIVRNMGRIHLLIIGNDSQSARRNSFTKNITEAISHDGKIHHISYVSKEELPGLYSMADIFVFPSRLEGFGLVVAEAMSCGLPVVATACKGVREIVRDGKTGYLTPVGDAEAFADRISHLIHNPERRKKMGIEGRGLILREFTWDISLSRTEQMLLRSLSRRIDSP